MTPATLPQNLGVVAVFRRKLARIAGLKEVLGASELLLRPGAREAARVDTVVGWGHRPTTARARAFAERHGLPFVRLEDGFLRSVTARSDARPLSLVLDDRGIYYDARAPSLIESWLEVTEPELLRDPVLLERARRARDFIVEHELSKYNHTLTALPPWLKGETRELVLVVDQSRGDQSIVQGLAGPDSFEQMLTAALAEHPRALVLVKTHPDARFRGKGSYYSRRASANERVRLVTEPLNPIALLKRVEHVYVCTSQLGFEALLVGRRVSCFGVPFYAGWGLTDDRVPAPRRTRRRTVQELTVAALFAYPRYLHPITRTRCEPEVVLEHLALSRRTFAANAATHFCFGFTPWKRGFVRRYLTSPSGRVRFCRSLDDARRGGLGSDARFVVWGQRAPAGLRHFAQQHGVPWLTMEDGFLRSVGLGSDFTLPLSLVLDGVGIYYDPTRPSALEQLLESADFSPGDLARAAALRRRIVESGLSKYNLADVGALALSHGAGQRVLLVPGQVEDDASIRLGAPEECCTNAALLAAARRCDPGAHILYRPHPEVVSGNRKSEPVPSGAYDSLVEGVPLSVCLQRADSVHTMTSLVGFEALLRGIEVVTHGRPFYAGWGLTRDQVSCARRTRRLTLDQLVAGALLCYPRYFSHAAGAFVSAEDAVTELLLQRDTLTSMPARGSRAARQLGKLINLVRDLIHAR